MSDTKEKRVLFRYEPHIYASCWEDDVSRGTLKVELTEYQIVAETPKGKWVGWGKHKTHFVLNNAKKRFAYDTKERALESFIIRSERRIEILTDQLDRTKQALCIAKRLKEPTSAK